MITREPSPHDETAVQVLLAAAVEAGPPSLARRPPTLSLIGGREMRLRQVRRTQRTASAVAAVMIAALAVVALPHVRPTADPATVSVQTSMVATSDSMEPTIHPGDSLLIDATAGAVQQLHRGDIIVFKDPGDWLPQPAPGQSARWLVKRVIGLPGDNITCCDAAGRLIVNRVAHAEP